MFKRFAALAAVVLMCNLAMGQKGWTKTPSGSYKIERVWDETLGDYTFANAIATYRNTTDRTFEKAVTLKATFYDKSGGIIDTCVRSFFCFETGPIKPGFEDSIKFEIECTKGQLKSASVKITKAY
jgi:hypothetical protein